MNYALFVKRLDDCYDLSDDASSKGKTWSVRQKATQDTVQRTADRIEDECDFIAIIDHVDQLYYAFRRRKRFMQGYLLLDHFSQGMRAWWIKNMHIILLASQLVSDYAPFASSAVFDLSHQFVLILAIVQALTADDLIKGGVHLVEIWEENSPMHATQAHNFGSVKESSSFFIFRGNQFDAFLRTHCRMTWCVWGQQKHILQFVDNCLGLRTSSFSQKETIVKQLQVVCKVLVTCAEQVSCADFLDFCELP